MRSVTSRRRSNERQAPIVLEEDDGRSINLECIKLARFLATPSLTTPCALIGADLMCGPCLPPAIVRSLLCWGTPKEVNGTRRQTMSHWARFAGSKTLPNEVPEANETKRAAMALYGCAIPRPGSRNLGREAAHRRLPDDPDPLQHFRVGGPEQPIGTAQSDPWRESKSVRCRNPVIGSPQLRPSA